MYQWISTYFWTLKLNQLDYPWKKPRNMCTKIQFPLKSRECLWYLQGTLDSAVTGGWKIWLYFGRVKYNLITILLEILHCLVSLLSFEIQLQNILKHGAVHFLVTTLQYNLELSYAKSASWIAEDKQCQVFRVTARNCLSIFVLSLQQKNNKCRTTFSIIVEIIWKKIMWEVLSKELFSTAHLCWECILLVSTLIYFIALVVVWWKLLSTIVFEWYIMGISFKFRVFLSELLNQKVWFCSGHWSSAALQSEITSLCLRHLDACQCLQT